MSLFKNKKELLPPGPVLCRNFILLFLLKLRREPLGENLVIPLSPKRTLWEAVRDVGIVLSSREWSSTFSLGTGGHLLLMGTLQPCVFPLQLVFSSGGRSELSLLDEFMIPAHEGCKDLKIHIPAWSWILLGALQHLISLGLLQDSLSVLWAKKYPSSF